MKLSVNLNKVALLRNSRGAAAPCPVKAAAACLDAGAHGITLHWRADSRHTRSGDVRRIAALCKARHREFNLEGDPRPALLELAHEVQPTQLTLVPVSPGEITSDHGWDLEQDASQLQPVVRAAQAAGMRVAVFVDAGVGAARARLLCGADRIEIYTEPYASGFAAGACESALGLLRKCAREASRAGLGVNAGHDLSLSNLPRLAREVPEVAEVSIGHALVGEALYLGFQQTIGRYLQACRGQDVAGPAWA